ncbi:MAG: bacteriohemerythrin [Treponema sp.]|jgi:hemerythrin|nr:bacteriohemerythrin [Treponema sp.]
MAVDKDVVNWKNTYSVGIKLIDDQHKQLISMTNDLFLSCLKGDDVARAFFKKVIHGAVDYIKVHFDTEEKLMRKIAYPDFAAHKREHEEFIGEVLLRVKDFEEGRKFVPNAFARFLKEWVLTHIAMSDKKYANFIWAMRQKEST